MSSVSQFLSAEPRRASTVEYATLPWLFRAADFFGIVIMSAVCYAYFNNQPVDRSVNLYSAVMIGLVVGSLFTGLGELRDAYRADEVMNIPIQVRNLTVNWLAAWLFLAFTAFALRASGDFSRLSTGMLVVLTLPVLFALRLGIRRWFTHAVINGQISNERVALLQVGDGAGLPAQVRSEFAIVNSQVVAPEALASFDVDMASFIRETARSRARKVLVYVAFANLSLIGSLSEHLRRLPIPSMIVTDEWLTRAFQRPTVLHGDLTAFELQAPPLTIFQRMQKRSMDLIIAGVGLFFLAPLLTLIAIAVKWESPGPVFFRQRRRGFSGKEFQIFKFRSMRVLEDGDTIIQVGRDDDRVTKVGRFIRSTSLDELPQLLNVLRGEMSLIGPRPHAIAHDNQYDELIGDYSLRRHMKPGLTGWAQVNGHRGETPTTAHMSARVEHDLWYIGNWSIWLDIWILLRTAKELLSNRNVY